MIDAAEMRAEAARLREFVRTVDDPEVVEEINFLVAELERKARLMDNGSATDDDATALPIE